jgi:hypothetical protein
MSGSPPDKTSTQRPIGSTSVRAPALSASLGASIGAVHLVVANSATAFRTVGIDLELKTMVGECSSVATPIGEGYQMECSFP